MLIEQMFWKMKKHLRLVFTACLYQPFYIKKILFFQSQKLPRISSRITWSTIRILWKGYKEKKIQILLHPLIPSHCTRTVMLSVLPLLDVDTFHKKLMCSVGLVRKHFILYLLAEYLPVKT